MRIAGSAKESDLTTRAKLRNAAIDIFAMKGFGASVREIAAHAGVTAGLITHHFGTKNNLRAECDEEVFRQYRTLKGDAIAMSPAQSMGMLAESDEYAPLVIYILRSMQAGGPTAIGLLEHMIEETVAFSQAGVESGVVRPSRDPGARARYLVTTGFGGVMLQVALYPDLDLADMGPTVRKILADITLPTLELYTEGVLTDRRYLDEYLLYMSDPPNEPTTTPPTNIN